MLKAILIDDESNCLKMLEWELQNTCPEVNILAKCETGKDGLKAIKDLHPDLVFLDVEMPYMNGFEMLDLVPEVNFEVIFTTAYDEYAVKAFKISAVDYLLKPIDGEELRVAIDKVSEKKQLHSKVDSRHLEVLMDQVSSSKKNGVKNIALPTYEGYVFVKINQILYCQSDNNYTRVILDDGKPLLISRTLKEVGEMLTDFQFYRVHNSFIVNLNEIANYIKSDGGYLIMSNGDQVKVSRTKKEELLKHFG